MSGRRDRARPARALAQPVQIGSVTPAQRVMTASGTAGYGTELAGLVRPVAVLGPFVTKSLAAFEWAGNPAPRLHPTAAGMLNAVGLQGPGVPHWPTRRAARTCSATGATVVASIWGRTVDEYRQAAALLATAPAGVVAVEVNLSCPNLRDGRRRPPMFAHDPSGRRRWWPRSRRPPAGRAGRSSAPTPTGCVAVAAAVRTPAPRR